MKSLFFTIKALLAAFFLGFFGWIFFDTEGKFEPEGDEDTHAPPEPICSQ